jgi:23S rRNA (cytosine1962-C5)-methyltransferase
VPSSSRPAPSRPAPGKWLTAAQLKAFSDTATTAHRIYSSADAWIERFGDDVLLSYKDEGARQGLEAELTQWADDAGLQIARRFGRLLPKQNEERAAPILLSGDPAAPLQTVVEENGMRFGINFSAGYSAGLFIDQRANRAFLRATGARRLLNTFAYTCSFSVAAALSGANTTSVDLSKKSLDRGRQNFALNGIDAAPHQFYADDVMELLPRLARKRERFDAIILDPPTFSRGHKGQRFQVERDLEALLVSALELAAPLSRVLLSTNCTRLDRRALETIARYVAKLTRRSCTFHTEPDLPDLPPELSARTLWLLYK